MHKGYAQNALHRNGLKLTLPTLLHQAACFAYPSQSSLVLKLKSIHESSSSLEPRLYENFFKLRSNFSNIFSCFFSLSAYPPKYIPSDSRSCISGCPQKAGSSFLESFFKWIILLQVVPDQLTVMISGQPHHIDRCDQWSHYNNIWTALIE
jgi:hypothetical protein